MTLLWITVLTLTLVTLSNCDLHNDNFDEGVNGRKVSVNYGGRASWRRAVGYKECDDNMPIRVNTNNGYKIYNADKGSQDSQPRPLSEICSEYECPKYEELNTTGCGYGARRIYGTTWITTTFSMANREVTYMEGFWKLFTYISGYNDVGAKIPMTVPVLTQVLLDASYQPLDTAFMSFYMSSDYQSTPPTPLDSAVEINEWDEDVVIYYRAFGGEGAPSDKQWEDEFTKLYQAVTKSGKTIYEGEVLTAGYTRPGFGKQRWEAIYIARDNE